MVDLVARRMKCLKRNACHLDMFTVLQRSDGFFVAEDLAEPVDKLRVAAYWCSRGLLHTVQSTDVVSVAVSDKDSPDRWPAELGVVVEYGLCPFAPVVACVDQQHLA